MRVWNGLDAVTDPFPESAVAIGVFDGIHLGHQELIRRAAARADERAEPAVVLSFDRHPAELVAPDHAPAYLTTARQREALLRETGVTDLVVAHFDERFRDLSPETFLRFVLKGILGAESVFVGHDFRFGCEHAGDVTYLREAQDRLAFTVTVLDPVIADGERASSSRVRTLIAAGDISAACRVLGHAYRLEGVVVEGAKLGRSIGWPTANLALSTRQVVPADGIYAAWVYALGRRFMGACSIGLRPTVDGTQRTIETYLLDFDGDLYGMEMELEPVTRLRDELKFDSLDSLAAQISVDVKQTREILAPRD